jgi:hypothetical protein
VEPFVNEQEYSKASLIAEQFCSTEGLGQKLLEERATKSENWVFNFANNF